MVGQFLKLHPCVPSASQFADFPDPMLYSDYLPELSRHETLSCPANPDLGAEEVSWEDLVDMDLPSFRPAFLVLCRVLLNVIHECLKLRLEQRPAGEPSLLSIKQASGAATEKKTVCGGGALSLCAASRFDPSRVLCSWCASARRCSKAASS